MKQSASPHELMASNIFTSIKVGRKSVDLTTELATRLVDHRNVLSQEYSCKYLWHGK